ncbi:MAG: response regulator [Dehalococcoidia bacterium]|nr:response regulator [Dehalococcoidia bacterium]
MDPRGEATTPRTVFIVDDEADHALIARHVLQGMAPDIDVRVLSALEGLAAELASAPRDSAVLLDRLIGGVESYPTLQEVVAARPDVRVTLVSAWLTPEEARRAREAGASVATEKPGSLEGWRALFRSVLGGA